MKFKYFKYVCIKKYSVSIFRAQLNSHSMSLFDKPGVCQAMSKCGMNICGNIAFTSSVVI